MKTSWLLCVVALAGCAAQMGDEGVWVDASPALKDRGIQSYRVETSNDPSVQSVALRGPGAEAIGRVQIAGSTVALALRATTWRQEIAAATGEMTLTLDGQTAILKWDGSAWQGDAAGRVLLAQSQPFIELVGMVAGEAKLQPVAPPSSAENKPASDAGSVAKPDAGAPSLVCSTAVVTGAGWAWYWEEKAQAMSCRRANDALAATCELSSGYACCNVTKDCVSCINWGTGYACSTAGYLQYASY